MVDGDDAERLAGGVLGERDGHGRCGEGGVDAVDRDGVVRVGSVAGDVAVDGELAVGGGEGFGGDEGGDRVREIDAVDEDVGLLFAHGGLTRDKAWMRGAGSHTMISW